MNNKRATLLNSFLFSIRCCVVLFLTIFSANNAKAQCIGTRQAFGPFVAAGPGSAIFWDNRTQFLANWSLVTLKAGNSYNFAGAYLVFNQSFLHSNTELTLTDTNNNVLAFGTSPIVYSPPVNMVVRLHQFSQNGACGATESGNGGNGHRFIISTTACARASSTAATCVEIANGSATIIVDSSTGTNTYTWAPTGDTAATATGLAPGNYTCTVTNVCSATVIIPIVVQNLAPTATITNTTDTIICDGQKVTLQAGLPNNPPITSYLWNNGDTTASINAGIGNYTVVVKTPNGCSSKPSITKQIVPKQLRRLTIQSGGNNLCFVQRTNLTVDVTGIDTPTYLWSNGSTLASPTVGSGNYSVVVTEAGRCKYYSDTLTIDEKLGKATIVTSDSQLCANQTKILGAFIPDNRFVSSVISSRGSIGNINDIKGPPNNASAFVSNQLETSEIVLAFNNPIPINYVAIYETDRFGMIDSVSIKNPNTNQWELVYSKVASLDFAKPLGVTTRIVFPLTTYAVAEVKIHATILNFEYLAIDAVEIGRPLPATNYLWSTGSTSPIINAPLGNYAAILTDTSGCRFISDTLTLTEKIGVAQIVSSSEPICVYDTKPLTAIAAEKQWAGSVISHNGINPQSIIGPANSSTWFGSANSSLPNQFIVVRFSEAMPISFINVYELGRFGTLDSVFVKNPNTNQWVSVYGRVRPSIIDNSAPQDVVSHIEFPLTSFAVSEVRIQAYYISFNSIIIDAVEIGRDVQIANYKWSTNTTNDTLFAMPGKYTVELGTIGTAGCRFISDSMEVELKVLPAPTVTIEEIPAINPNVTFGGTATASDFYGRNDAADAFDGDLVTKGWAGIDLPAQLNYDFGMGNSKTVTRYRLYCSPDQEGGWSNQYNLKKWYFEGYNGANWIVLDSQNLANFPDNAWQTYTFSNNTAYQKYRLNIIENNDGSGGSGSYAMVTEMELLASPVLNNCDNKLFLATVNTEALPANYQWKVNGENVGTNNDTLTLPNFAKSSSITCVVSPANACLPAPTTTSNAIILNTGTVLNVVDTGICSGRTFTYNAVTYNATGVYTDTLVAASGCDSIVGLILTVATPIVVTVNSGSICRGDTFEITPSGAFSYTIDNGGSFKVSPALTTIYFITGTDEFGCSSASSVASTVNVNELPTLLISSSDTVLCAGQSTTLTANGALNYRWNTGDSTRNVLVSPAVTTTYSLTGVDANGCKSINAATKTVSVSSLPTIIILATDTLLCVGENATLTASGAQSYTWNTGALTNAITVSPTTLTKYTVSGIDANGCIGIDSITIDVVVCTSLNEQVIKTSAAFSIIPNPNNGVFTVRVQEFEKEATIQIVNLLGEEVYSQQMDNNDLTITQNLPTGIYTIRLFSNNNVQTKKLIIR